MFPYMIADLMIYTMMKERSEWRNRPYRFDDFKMKRIYWNYIQSIVKYEFSKERIDNDIPVMFTIDGLANERNEE